MHLQVAAIWKLSFALSFLYINSFCLLSYNQKAVTLLYFNLVFHPLQCFDCGQNRNQYIMADNLPPKKLFVYTGTLCYKRHTFVRLWNSQLFKLDTRVSFQKSESFQFIFLCFILFTILLVRNFLRYWWCFLNVQFWEN